MSAYTELDLTLWRWNLKPSLIHRWTSGGIAVPWRAAALDGETYVWVEDTGLNPGRTHIMGKLGSSRRTVYT